MSLSVTLRGDELTGAHLVVVATAPDAVPDAPERPEGGPVLLGVTPPAVGVLELLLARQLPPVSFQATCPRLQISPDIRGHST